MFQHGVKAGVLLTVELRVFEKRNVSRSADLLEPVEYSNRFALQRLQVFTHVLALSGARDFTIEAKGRNGTSVLACG
jgi:hypothetical protein